MTRLQTMAEAYLAADVPLPLDLAVGLAEEGLLLDEYTRNLDGFQIVDVDDFDHFIYD